jgi:MFS family permease
VRLPAILVPLRHRDFRLLLVGQSVSSVGNFFFNIAAPFQLLALGATPVELGIAAFIQIGSTTVFLLLGGAIADRVSRRRLILANDALGGVVTAVIAVLAWTAQLRIEHIYVAEAVLGAAFAFLFPAYSAIVTELVPADQLTQGNAARSLGSALARTAGPLAAGLVLATSGAPLAFAVDALTFFFSFLLFTMSRATPKPEDVEVPLLRQVRDGISFVIATPWLWMALVAYTFLNLTYGGQRGVMTPIFVRDALLAGGGTFGIVIAAHGVGQIVGGIMVAQLPIRRPGVAMYVFEVLAGAATLAVGLFVWLPATLIAFTIMGVALSSSDTLFNAAIQRNVPGSMLGRVTSINFLVAGLFVPIAPVIAGVLVDAIGSAMTFVLAGAWAVALALVLLAVSPVKSLR